MAGEYDSYEGDVTTFPGISVGYLDQEPALDSELTVKENVIEGIEDEYEVDHPDCRRPIALNESDWMHKSRVRSRL